MYSAQAGALLKTDPKEALVKARESVRIKEGLYKKKKTLDNLDTLSFSYNFMGNIYSKLDNAPMAEHFYRKAVEGIDILYERWGMIEVLHYVPEVYYNIGELLVNKRDNDDEAIYYFKKSIDVQDELFANTGDQTILENLSWQYAELCSGLRHTKRFEEAEIYYKRYIKLIENIYASEPTNEYAEKINDAYYELSYIEASKNPPDPKVLLDFNIKRLPYIKKLADETGEEKHIESLATTYIMMSMCYSGIGKPAEAAEYERKHNEELKKIEG